MRRTKTPARKNHSYETVALSNLHEIENGIDEMQAQRNSPAPIPRKRIVCRLEGVIRKRRQEMSEYGQICPKCIKSPSESQLDFAIVYCTDHQPKQAGSEDFTANLRLNASSLCGSNEGEGDTGRAYAAFFKNIRRKNRARKRRRRRNELKRKEKENG